MPSRYPDCLLYDVSPLYVLPALRVAGSQPVLGAGTDAVAMTTAQTFWNPSPALDAFHQDEMFNGWMILAWMLIGLG